ncbi:Aspartate racemase, partial [Actinobacteria bacterium OK074]
MPDLSAQLADLTPEQRLLLARRLKQKQPTPVRTRAVGRRPGPLDRPVLSLAQERMWFLQQLYPDSPEYNRRIAYTIEGPLRPELLGAAFEHVVRRHTALRTSVTGTDGVPTPVLHDATALPLRLLPGHTEESAAELVVELCTEPFALAGEPLLRAALLGLSPERHLLVVVMHHTVSDGWSDGILVGELAAAYSALAAGAELPAAAPEIEYADYAHWQRRRIAEGGLAAQSGYWRERLRGAAPLDLVPDRTADSTQRRSGRCDFVLSAALTEAVGDLARALGATLFMALTAGFATVLHRRSGQEDIVVGTTSAGRTRPELEGVIGYFVNTLPLRTEITADSTFVEVLGRMRDTAVGAFANQEVPFAQIVEAALPDRGADVAPVVQATCALQNAPTGATRIAGLAFTPYDVPVAANPFGLALSFTRQPDGLRGRIEYDAGAFDEATVTGLATALRELYAAVAADPDRPVGTLPLLSADRRAEVRAAWNGPVGDRSSWSGGVHREVLARIARTPERVVLRSGTGAELTGAELLARVGAVASALRTAGVGPESRVGLHLRRGPDLVVGMLGVLAAGGCYVPLDPAQPAARLASVAQQADFAAVL